MTVRHHDHLSSPIYLCYIPALLLDRVDEPHHLLVLFLQRARLGPRQWFLTLDLSNLFQYLLVSEPLPVSCSD